MSKKRLTIQIYKKLFDLHEDGYSIEDALRKLDIDFSPRQLAIDYHKYKKHGYEGLKDGRGKGKPQAVLSTEKALKAEIKILKERNKYLQMENDVLKKEKAIERQLMKQALDKKRHTKR